MLRVVASTSLCLLLGGCSYMYHSAIGERLGGPGPEVEAGVDTTGVNTEAIGETAADLAGDDAGAFISFIVWATTFAPSTGKATDSDQWADHLTQVAESKCPGGTLTGIQITREASDDYHYVSGELVRLKAVCVSAGRDP